MYSYTIHDQVTKAREWASYLSLGLGEAEEIRVARVEDSHDTGEPIRTRFLDSNKVSTYPTRKSFPAAVPRATLVPAKWWTVVLESMA